MKNTKHQAIEANLDVLADVLECAAHVVASARQYLQDGGRHSAIGALLELDTRLENAQALREAIVLIYKDLT